jgi:hypothetical protein
MPTTKKRSASSPKARTGDYRKSYVRLRTVLDALEIAALRSYLAGKTDTERNQAAEKIVPMITDVINRLKSKGLIETCPPGLNNCGGCCVPYECPEGFVY